MHKDPPGNFGYIPVTNEHIRRMVVEEYWNETNALCTYS